MTIIGLQNYALEEGSSGQNNTRVYNSVVTREDIVSPRFGERNLINRNLKNINIQI